MAPVAVEPRKINQPKSDNTVSAPATTTSPEAEVAAEGGKKLPLIPILAAVVAIIVVGLLVKVLRAN